MAVAAAATTTAGTHYAPNDPSLLKPWEGLVDGKTLYLCFWNPVANVTQYQRPSEPKESPPPQKQDSPALDSTVTSEQFRDDCNDGDDVRHERSGNGNGRSMFSSETETTKSGSDYAYDTPKETVASEHEGTPTQTNMPSAGSGLTPDEYSQRHEITVSGNNVCQLVQVNIGSIDQLVANKSITQHVELWIYPEKQWLMMMLVVSMLKIFGL